MDYGIPTYILFKLYINEYKKENFQYAFVIQFLRKKGLIDYSC